MQTPTPFYFYPAIDILDKKVVRLYQGKYDQVTIYNESVREQILEFAEAGSEWLHIVDLNAARSGTREVNSSIWEELISIKKMYPRLRLQLGGGIRSMKAIEECLSLNIERCVLGTAAVKNPDFLQQALKKFGQEKIVVGVDALEGYVKTSGWEVDDGTKVDMYLKILEEMGVKTVIFTDISRDGTLQGQGDVYSLHKENTHLNFIVSGGLSSLEDIQVLLRNRASNVVGAISGRAIYEKKINLREALALTKQ